MTRDDIMRMSREALTKDDGGYLSTYEYLERFAALVAAAEREACAKVCEDASKPREGEMHSDAQWAALVLSTSIRARSKT